MAKRIQTKKFEDAQYIKKRYVSIKKEIQKVIVGQDEMIEAIIIALFSDGHVLLEGYPGLGKTITIKTLSRAIDARFQRIQFTPDLIPSDITGFELCDPETRKSAVQK